MDLLKVASSALNIGPQHAMQVAERLYTRQAHCCSSTAECDVTLGRLGSYLHLLPWTSLPHSNSWPMIWGTAGYLHMRSIVTMPVCCSGWISYPRTESTAYAAGFDMAATVQQQCRHPVWGEYAKALLHAGIKHPKVSTGECAPRTCEIHVPFMIPAHRGQLFEASWLQHMQFAACWYAPAKHCCNEPLTSQQLQ